MTALNLSIHSMNLSPLAHIETHINLALQCWLLLLHCKAAEAAGGLRLNLTDVPWSSRMLPGINAAAVGLIIAAVFQLMFSVRENSPTPAASTAIGASHAICIAEPFCVVLSGPGQAAICLAWQQKSKV